MKKRKKKSKKKKLDYKKALVLNADFTCMSIIGAKEGLESYIKNMYDPEAGLEAVDFYDIKVLSCGGKYFPVPCVLKTTEYIKPKGKKIKFCKKNVFIRDNMTCMYCGQRDHTCKTLTRDHVIPRAIWNRQNHTKTPTDWLNIVTACKKCNFYKRNRTPKQAGMKLKMEPFEPNPHNHLLGFCPWMAIEPEWEIYLPKNYKNLIKKT